MARRGRVSRRAAPATDVTVEADVLRDRPRLRAGVFLWGRECMKTTAGSGEETLPRTAARTIDDRA